MRVTTANGLGFLVLVILTFGVHELGHFPAAIHGL